MTTALLGIDTTALETPLTPCSADRTLAVHPAPQVIPVMVRLTVFVSLSAALITLGASTVGSAITFPKGSAVRAQSASSCVVFFMVSYLGFWGGGVFPFEVFEMQKPTTI